MRRGDWQFVAGTALTLVLAIPTIRTFASGNASLIALTALITLLACVVVSYLWYRLRLPPFTIRQHSWLVTLKDVSGEDVVVRKTVQFLANRSGVDSFAHRGNASDGTITGFRADDSVNHIEQELIPGGITVRVRFFNAVRVGTEIVTWLEADHRQGFTKSSEYFIADVDLPMKRLDMEVAFPDARPPSKWTVVRRYAATDYPLLETSTNAKRLKWKCEPRWGHVPFGEYYLRWWW